MGTYYVAKDGKEFKEEKFAIAHNTYLAGKAEDNNGNKAEAINYYTTAINSYNHYPYTYDLHYVYLARARTYLNMEKYDLAEDDIEGVIAYGNL